MHEVMTPTEAELKAANCWFPRTDRVQGDELTTSFKQSARYHQNQWREARDLPVGSNPYDPADVEPGHKATPNGSRIAYETAIVTKDNLLSDAAKEAADHRVAHPEKHQMLNRPRLWCDLLSSMPMCFNLFGPLWADRRLAQQAVNEWFPDAPGSVCDVRFEWSPGRCDPDFLGNKTAFDVAIELDLGGGKLGVIGIETKYHEHVKPEEIPKPERLKRYATVARNSRTFNPNKIDSIPGQGIQQLWQDHLLALSMRDHISGKWAWVKYALIYPGRNPSFATAVNTYRGYLAPSDRTYGALTVEHLLGSGIYSTGDENALRTRYLW